MSHAPLPGRPVIQAALTRYDRGPWTVKAVGDVAMAASRRGCFCLKAVPGDGAGELTFQLGLLLHLRRQGFPYAPTPVPTADGSPWVETDGCLLYMTTWLPGEPVRFAGPDDAAKAAGLLAHLHRCGAGYVPTTPAPSICQRTGKWRHHLQERMGDLQQFHRWLARRAQPLPALERACLRHYPLFRRLAEEALLRLNGPALERLSLSEGERLAVTHGDFNDSNLVREEDGALGVVDWSSCAYDLNILDLLRLIWRNCRWDLSGARTILAGYAKERELSADELEVLRASLLFPHEFWWAARIYCRKGRAYRNGFARSVGQVEQVMRFTAQIDSLAL